MTKLVVLRLEGDLATGVQVRLEIGEEGKRASIEISGSLPPAPDLTQAYDQWQDGYHCLGRAARIKPGKTTIDGDITPEKCQKDAERVRSRLNEWLSAKEFIRLKEKLYQQLHPNEEVRVLIRTNSEPLRQLPWQLWKLIEDYDRAEVALSGTEYELLVTDNRPRDRKRVKILAILGDSTGIEVDKDKQFLASLPHTNITFLVEPQREEINNQLWEQSWDILFFAGHSRSEGETGRIYLNETESLRIDELKRGLEKAVRNGLQLAIFNSCDGLGLARALQQMRIPQLIVMREPVPDQVAQRYLKYFLTAFTQGEKLYLAQRKARQRLEDLESKFPCASWLPAIFQHPAVVPLTLEQLLGPSRDSSTAQDTGTQLTRQEFRNAFKENKTIMVQARDTSNDLDPKYSFTTEEIKNATFYFEIQGGEPVKLGDGTYGVVYQAYDETLQKFAVKLLYESQSLEQATMQPVLSDEIINSFRENFKLQDEDPVLEKIKAFQRPIDNISSFTLGILRTGIDDDQYRFLLDQVLQNYQSTAVDRFLDEINAAKEIRRCLQDFSAGNLFVEGVIETLGGTKKFRSSAAYMNLNNTFKASRVKVSDYALVMPLYHKTLKELLEKGIGRYRVRRKSPEVVKIFSSENTSLQQLDYLRKEELEEKIASLNIKDEQKQIIKENIYELVGYDILKEMDFSERISTILPYLIRIAIGLNVLYAANLSHLDLKPANIFVKETQIFDVVIGDLGFLKPEKVTDAAMMSSVRDYLPLGTRHYRSPEQKDYFDICNVEIRQEKDDSGNTIASLVVRDPKFRDTIIEKNDYLVFSKDTARIKYEIDQIIKKNDDLIVIMLRIDKETHKRLKPEKQTQIILYKRQDIRTDLFGLGAIAFDMLTCGESPERFYDNIRGYDAEETDLDNLMQLYTAVSSFQSSEPRLVHVFTPLQHQHSSKYAPPDIVRLILKCLLYKAKQTFYDANRGVAQQRDDYNSTMKAVLDYLNDLGRKYQLKYDNNPLKTGTLLTPSKETQSGILSQKIKNLQDLPRQKLPLRLAQGIWYFKGLVEFLRKTITSQETFFSELLPENIIINQERMAFSYIVYQNETDYKNDLKNDSVYTKIVRNIANPYVPDYITFLRRSISLEKIPQANYFRYNFSDSSLLGDQVSVGDWIVINSQLWRIATVSNYEIMLEDEEGNQATDFQTHDDKSDSYIYYKNLDPCTHYLTMLGIYLYQIFFVGLGDATVNKPLIINIAKSRLYMMKSGSEDIKIKPFLINEQNAQQIADPIFQFIARMYVKLTFSEAKNSYYKENSNDRDRIIAIDSEVGKLQEMIEKFVEVKRLRLNQLVNDFDNSHWELLKSQDKIFDSFPQKLEFNELIKSFLTIQLTDKPSGLGGIFNRLMG